MLGNGSENTNTLIDFGANYILLTKAGEYYRLITSGFLHIGVIHLLLNMYSLYIVGTQVEYFYGKVKYIIIYLFSAVTGNLLSMIFTNGIGAGASGAIFGLLGSLLYFGYHYRGYIGAMIRSQIVPVVVYNLLIGFFISGIDMWGHVGGLLGGILTANMLGTIEDKKYNISSILLFVIYFVFLIYLGIYR
jgi:rhomboid protease GluP